MEFNENNYETANELIKSILFMYVDLMKTGEIANDIEYGTFNELEYVNSTLDKSLDDYDIDIDLINIGSAIKILCIIYEQRDQYENIEEAYDSEYFTEIKKALVEGKFKHLPDIENFIELLFKTDKGFDEALKPIVDKYVAGYFERLLTSYKLSLTIVTELWKFRIIEMRTKIVEFFTPHEKLMLSWDYSEEIIEYPCTLIAKFPDETAIVYSEDGFASPDNWGVISLTDKSFGRDDGWFISLEDAFIASGYWDGELPENYEVN